MSTIPRLPVIRFWDFVDTDSDEGCWLWLGRIRPDGYGTFWDGKKTVRAHRFSYVFYVGEIGEGLNIDHRCHSRDGTCAGGDTCRHRRCVNPFHLDAVPHEVNNARGLSVSANKMRWSSCPSGHPYDPDNTYIDPKRGSRNCRTCRREANRRSERKRRLAKRSAKKGDMA